MRRRVEEHVPAGEADRQLKLGPGGLRDVEFSVQLLQLVHGRADESLRSRHDAGRRSPRSRARRLRRARRRRELDAAYRLLRTWSTGSSCYRLRRTHLMPTAEADLRRLGRALGHRARPGAGRGQRQWQRQAREVRRLHERLFYRPLLAAVARLSPDEARLDPRGGARAAGGARLPRPGRGAAAHRGAHRRASAGGRRSSAQLLPVMLGWFADEADPDAGLLAFRRVSDELGATPLVPARCCATRASAAERLAHVLARSRYAADLLQRAPESVADPGRRRAGCAPATRDALRAQDARRGPAPGRPRQGRAGGRAAIRRRELFRIAVADLLGQPRPRARSARR